MSISNVSKIAILNPYLDLNLTEFSDKRYFQSFIDAAKKLGIKTAIFKRSNEIYDFNPDFVISVSPQEPKLTHFPTYLSILSPLDTIGASQRFTRNLLTYDGYFSTSSSTIDRLKNLCHSLNKSFYSAHAAFSVDKTESNPLDFHETSIEMANRPLSQEFFIENMLKMHNQVLNQNGYVKDMNNNDVITYFIHIDNSESINSAMIEQFKQQTHANIQIAFLYDEKNTSIQKKLKPYLNQNISALHYSGIECNPAIIKFLQDSNSKWFGIIKPNDKLFSNHCTMLLKAYQNSAHDKNNENVVILFSNSLEHSDKSDLKDYIQDDQILFPTDNVRVGNITANARVPFCAVLFKLTEEILLAFSNSDFKTNIRIDFQPTNDPVDIAIHNNAITCSSSTNVNEKQAELIIHNVVSAPNPATAPSNKAQVEPVQNRDYQSTIDRIFYEPQKPIIDTKKYQHTVGIILRTKDRPICVPRAIKSIMNQTFKDWQLVIVNDGGNLNALVECLQPFVQDIQERLVLINNSVSVGMSRALNIAIDQSSSEFIVVHDDDDTWHPEFLAHTVSFLRLPENNDCCAVTTHSMRVTEEIVNGTIVERGRDDFNSFKLPYARVELYRLLMQNTIATNAFLFKRSIIDKIGYFNEDLPVLNDWDFNIRCALQHEIGVIPQPLAYYHHRVNQQHTSYGNSIIHTSHVCLQYETVIRNHGLRNIVNSKNHSELLGLFFALGGQELIGTTVPHNIHQISNFLQQLPQWIANNTKATVEAEVNSLKNQLSMLQMKLDMLASTT